MDFRENRKALRKRRFWEYTLASFARIFIIVGLVLVGLATASISLSRADVPTETVALGADGLTPALHLTAVPPAETPPGEPAGSSLGTVIVVHGFAASKEFMRDIDYSLARAGFEVYGIDLPGLGHSGLRLSSSDLGAWFASLLGDMETKGLLVPGRVYLVGHSLGTLVVTQGALLSPSLGIRGVVALSPIFSDIAATAPANYLALVGESELGGVKEAAAKALQNGTGLADPKPETIYGDYEAGTARGMATVAGASHTSIPDAKVAIGWAITWLRSAAGVKTTTMPRLESEKAERGFGVIGVSLLILGLFYYLAGALGLLGHGAGRPRARAVVEDARAAAGLGVAPEAPPPAILVGRQMPPPGAPPKKQEVLPPAVVAAKEEATRLFAGTRVVPILFAVAVALAIAVPGFLGTFSFLRQSGTDYLVPYLLVYAVVLAPLVYFTGRLIKTGPLVDLGTRLGVPLSIALGLGLFALVFGGLGWFVTFSWTSALPPAGRFAFIVLLAVFFLPFSIVEEIIRGSIHDRTGFRWGFITLAISKLLMIVSWYAGLFLPVKPQALITVGPILVFVLIGFDFILSLFYNEHGSWLANALVKALGLAWVVGTLFPLLG